MATERRDCDNRNLPEYSCRFPHVKFLPTCARVGALIRCRSKKKVPVSCLAAKQLRRGNYFPYPPSMYMVAASTSPGVGPASRRPLELIMGTAQTHPAGPDLAH